MVNVAATKARAMHIIKTRATRKKDHIFLNTNRIMAASVIRMMPMRKVLL